MEKCEECFGYIGSSCCCAMADAMITAIISRGINPDECWVTSYKVTYEPSDGITVENCVVFEENFQVYKLL